MTARSTTAPPSVPAPRFAALHSRDYRWYYALGLLAMTADNIEHVISYWVIYQTFHSPTLGGFAVISHWVPFLLFSFHAGALADRYDCRRLIQTSQALFMVASIAWGVLFLTDRLQVWHAVVILLVHGAAGVIGAPAQQLIIHDMVGGRHLPSAIRLNASSRHLAILLGPAVGGGLMLLLGPAGGLLANVALYLPFMILLARVGYTGHAHASGQPPRARMGLAGAWRLLGELRADRRLVTMIALGGITSFFVGNAFQAQMPEYAHALGSDEAGLWYSDELGATWRLVPDGNGLRVEVRDRPSITARAVAADLFSAGTTHLSFRRDKKGVLTGFTVNAGRVRGIGFSRVPQ